tara:strand:- start:370 stop:507 length:138 start_codon:yes stop_codon:yes gene_type:complete
MAKKLTASDIKLARILEQTRARVAKHRAKIKAQKASKAKRKLERD